MKRWVSILLLILSCVVVYGNTLDNGFIYDDHDEIERNPYIRSAVHIPDYFKKPFWDLTGAEGFSSNIYRPLKLVSLYLDYQIGGSDPFVYHLSNLLFHVLAVLLFLLVLRRFGFSEVEAFWGALLFAVHPMASEAVYYLGARNDSLSAIFFFASLLGVASPKKWVAVSGVVAFFLSLLCKETPAILFPALIVTAYFRNGRRRAVTVGSMTVVTLVAYLLLKKQLGIAGSYDLFSTALLTPNFWSVSATYLRLLLLPFDPLGYRAMSAAVLDISCVLAVMIYVGLTVFLVKRRGGLLINLFVQVLIVCSIILGAALTLRSGIFADRYLYFAAAGLAILVLVATNRWPSKRIAHLFLVMIAVVFGLFAHVSGRQYQDDLSFWTFAGEMNEPSPVIQRNIGVVLYEAGRLPEARTHFERAVQLSLIHPAHRPVYLQSVHSLAAVEFREGKFEESSRQYLRLVGMVPENHVYWRNAAAALQRAKQCETLKALIEESSHLPANEGLSQSNYPCRGEGF